MYNRSRGRVRFQCSSKRRRRRRLCPPDVSADGKVPLGPAEPRILLWVKGLYDKPVLTFHLLSSVPFLRRACVTPKNADWDILSAGAARAPAPCTVPHQDSLFTLDLSILSLYILFLIASGVLMTNDLIFICKSVPLRNQKSCGILDTDPAFIP